MRLLSLLALSESRSRLVIAVLLLAVAGLSSCEKMPLLAPTESTIVLAVSTTRVAVSGTVEVYASVIESAGTPVHNGTVVNFTSSFGTVEPAEARTNAGRATVVFRAGQQSGTAVINAFSGGARAEAVEILVGGAAASAIAVSAEPRGAGVAEIVATVLDNGGNPLPGVPVTFTTTAGQLNPVVVVTAGNGQARTTLTTSREAVVTARAGEQSATVTVSPSGSSVTITPPTTIEAGIPATFRIAPPAGTTFRSVSINWGDGTAPTNLGTVSGETPVAHTFARAGIYTVVATSTDAAGVTDTSQIIVTVTEQAGIQLTFTATPNPVSATTNQGLVTFSATPGGLGGGAATIASYTWDFGNGQGAVTTANTTNHRYTASGTYIATVTVRSTTGQQGFGQLTIRVNP
jgi:PKD repeat protein